MQEDFSKLQIINNFYISLEEQRISRHRTIPQQVNFDFNQESLNAIAQMRPNRNSLSFDSELLTNLRYYSLLQCNNVTRSGLTFTSYYWQGEQKIAVISSNVSAQGQILQKIRHDFFVNFSLLEKIIDAHYWSIDQIFKQLAVTSQKKLYLLSWILPLLITFLIAILIFIFLSSLFSVKLLSIIIIFILTKFSLQYLIKNYLLKLILQQLLFGFLSHNSTRRKFGFILVNYLSINK